MRYFSTNNVEVKIKNNVVLALERIYDLKMR